MVGTTELVDRLKAEGFEVSLAYVGYLLRDRSISQPVKGPGGVLLWSPTDESRLRAELRRRGRAPVDYGRGIEPQREVR